MVPGSDRNFYEDPER